MRLKAKKKRCNLYYVTAFLIFVASIKNKIKTAQMMMKFKIPE
jgi:hypothetical protein